MHTKNAKHKSNTSRAPLLGRHVLLLEGCSITDSNFLHGIDLSSGFPWPCASITNSECKKLSLSESVLTQPVLLGELSHCEVDCQRSVVLTNLKIRSGLPALNLSGADLIGDLDVAECKSIPSLVATRARFMRDVHLPSTMRFGSGACAKLIQCHFDGNLTVEADQGGRGLDLSGTSIRQNLTIQSLMAELRLDRVHVDGEISIIRKVDEVSCNSAVIHDLTLQTAPGTFRALNSTIRGNITAKSMRVGGTFELSNSNVAGKLLADGSTFDSGITADDAEFQGEVSLWGCTFNAPISFRNSKFLGGMKAQKGVTGASEIPGALFGDSNFMADRSAQRRTSGQGFSGAGRFSGQLVCRHRLCRKGSLQRGCHLSRHGL